MLIRWYNLPALWRTAGTGERLMTVLPPALLPLLLLAGGETSIWLAGFVLLVCFVSALLKSVIGIVRFVVLPRRSARLVLWRLPLTVPMLALTVALAIGSYQSVRVDAAAELRTWQENMATGDAVWPCAGSDSCPRETGWSFARFRILRDRWDCADGTHHVIRTRLGPDIWTHFHLDAAGAITAWDQRDDVRTYLDPLTLAPLAEDPSPPDC